MTVVIWSSFLSLILELLDLVLQDSGVQLPDREVVFIKELINGENMVFILDGCSFDYAHTWSKSVFSIC